MLACSASPSRCLTKSNSSTNSSSVFFFCCSTAVRWIHTFSIVSGTYTNSTAELDMPADNLLLLAIFQFQLESRSSGRRKFTSDAMSIHIEGSSQYHHITQHSTKTVRVLRTENFIVDRPTNYCCYH